MDIEVNNSSSVEQKTKKVDRSAAYPAITIEESLSFVSNIYKHFRNDLAQRDDILSLIEGSHPRFIAASSYYGFLNREKDKYKVSDLYKTVTNYVDIKERESGLLQAFESPKLNKQLIEKFDGDQLPETLNAHLSRFYGITEEAAPLAADVFIKNAAFCGVLDNKNTLSFKKRKLKLEDNGYADTTTIVVEQSNITGKTILEQAKSQENNINGNNAIFKANHDVPPLLLEEIVDEEKTKVRLTGNKFAYIIYPRSIKKIDIEILKRQLDVIELLAE